MKAAKWIWVILMGVGSVKAANIEVDIVEEGKKIFETVGCSECHTVTKGDDSFKTGPNLFGLFLTNARERKVTIKGEEATVKADRAYFDKSLRDSTAELAISEMGPTKGTAYLPVMPTYTKALVSDDQMNSIYNYLRTLADGADRGPEKVMVKRRAPRGPSDPLKIGNEEIVTDRTRVFRGTLLGTSTRAIHVGQTNGVSYSFDPRMLSVRRIWSGGFLNMRGERDGRGQELPNLGNNAILHLGKVALLQPLTHAGEPVDFEFKEPDVQDFEAVKRHLWDKVDFADRMAALDAEFLGHRVPKGSEQPIFRFRVGKNVFEQTISISDQGVILVTLEGEINEAQKFQVENSLIKDVKVEGGSLGNGLWTIPAGAKTPLKFHAQINMTPAPRQPVDRKENWAPQKVVTKPAESMQKAAVQLPAGYSLQDWLAPFDLLGREQLFEPTGIAVAKDGTIVVATRTAGIWRIRNSEWTLFAEGTFEALGVCIEDDKGDVIVIAQKPELTRMRDENGDGRADVFETVSDDFGFHGNYHEYAHGPVRDAAGNYYFLLNLAHYGPPGKPDPACYRAGGKFMGSMGGYRGWAMRVTPQGKTEPFALGLRSPAGLGVAPDGRIWYAENQGEYVGSSHIVALEEGGFYGHPSAMVSLPGIQPDSPQLEKKALVAEWEGKVRRCAVWLPHNILANSPGNPAWDLTGGKFGSFKGQMFIGDQTLSQLMRVVTEQVDGKDQGCAILFGSGMASGIMRPVFLPDGSLLMGQTGRGWSARGGNKAAMQQVIYDGKTVHADLLNIRATPSGFGVDFTVPLDSKITTEQIKEAIKVQSWTYFFFKSGYGSPQHLTRDDAISSLSLSADRKSLSIELEGFGKDDQWVDKIYHIQIQQEPSFFGEVPVWKTLEGYYTLRAIPAK